MKLFINVSCCFDEELCSWGKEDINGLRYVKPAVRVTNIFINASVSSLDQFESGYLSLFSALIRTNEG